MAQANEFTISFSDPTGIDAVLSTAQGEDGDIYNVAGERLDRAQKGINIVGNKKVLVK